MKHDIELNIFVPCIELNNRQNLDLAQLSQAIFSGLDLSTGTIKDYRYRINKFLVFIDRNGFNRNALLDYKRQLTNGYLSVSTKNKYFISAKVFLKELYGVDYLEKDITINIKGFTQSHQHKKDGLSDYDIGMIQNYCKLLPPTSENLRLKAIISLLLF